MSNPTKIKKLNDYELAIKYPYYKNLFKIQYKLETLEKIKKRRSYERLLYFWRENQLVKIDLSQLYINIQLKLYLCLSFVKIISLFEKIFFTDVVSY